MNSLTDYIESGILELYVLGMTNEKETQEVQEMADAHTEIRDELSQVERRMEAHDQSQAVKPHSLVKTFTMASIDYIDRIKKGEKPQFPSELTSNSKIEDYAYWLNRDDMTLPLYAEEVHAKIIGNTRGKSMAIVWIKTGIEKEIHTYEQESFLIVEGSCEVYIENKTYSLKTGDYLSIPLSREHSARVTSNIPCKIILQRVAI